MPAYTPQQRITKFWNRVKITGLLDCWEWQGCQNNSGYGFVQGFDKKIVTTHRFVWVLTHDAIPEGQCVLHKCDNRLCCNPNHLYIGTHADNMRDKISRNRQARGETQGLSKLTEDNIREIRRLLADGIVQTVIASKYSVTRDNISQINCGLTWRHVDP